MKIIAHRGNDGVHRENSLKAIVNSLNKNYIDIRKDRRYGNL